MVRVVTVSTPPMRQSLRNLLVTAGSCVSLCAEVGFIRDLDGYDPLGAITRRTDGEGHATTYTRDDRGRVTLESRPYGW